MTLEIRRAGCHKELVHVYYAEYNDQIGSGGTAVIYVPEGVFVRSLDPYETRVGMTNLQKYFDAQEIQRTGFGIYSSCLKGLLLGRNGTAEFILYF